MPPLNQAILAVLGDFLSERIEMVKLDCVQISVVNVVLGVSQSTVFGPLLVFLYIMKLPPLQCNSLLYLRMSWLVMQMTPILLRLSPLLVKNPNISLSFNTDLGSS